jgi:SNF2 family DNA or RNA helicase
MSLEQMNAFTKYLEHGKLDNKQYQHDGVKWCVENETRADPPGGVRGGFIADEMGLGKTIMMIGTFVANPMLRTLIVVPPILLNQWYTQIYKTTGHKAIIYHGANKKKISQKQLEDAVIVLTTYSTFRKGGAKSPTFKKSGVKIEEKVDCDFAPLLPKVEWNRIVFDEAHHLRNNNSHHQWAKQLKSKIRWLVSGTPVQNKKRDFYNLCSVLGMAPSFYTDPANLPTIARFFILKRTKKQVGIQLPDMNVDKTVVQWANRAEFDLSQEIHSHLKFSNVKFSGTSTSSSSRLLLGENTQLSLLLKAKQMCVYPGLIKKKEGVFEGEAAAAAAAAAAADALSHTTKIDEVVKSVVQRRNNGCGKLIFCCFRGEIDLIYEKLMGAGMTDVVKLDGRVTGKRRGNIINNKNNVLILQIQTGCEGLNLQEFYSEVYFVSPHWNPAIEDQAIARCHRIGQTKNVLVERFVMGGFEEKSFTIEQHATNIQDIKRQIAEEIFHSQPLEKVGPNPH